MSLKGKMFHVKHRLQKYSQFSGKNHYCFGWNNICWFAAIAALLIIADLACAQEIILPRPTQGTTNFYRIEIVNKSEIVNMDGTILETLYPMRVSTTTLCLGVRETILLSDSTSTKAQYYIQDFDLSSAMAGITFGLGYDITGSSWTITTDREGRIIDVIGLDALAPFISEIGGSELMTCLRPPIPNQPLSKGSNWSSENNSRIPIGDRVVETKLRIDYKVLEVSTKPAAGVTVGLTIASDTKTRTLRKTGDYLIDLGVKGKGRGTLLYNLDQARVDWCRVDMDFSTRVTSELMGECSSMDMRQYSKMSMAVEKINSKR